MEDQELFLSFLDERISFIKQINERERNTNKLMENLLVLLDFMHCKALYLSILSNKENDKGDKRLTKTIARNLIFNCWYELDRQLYICIDIGGVSFPTQEVANLPDDVILQIEERRKYLKGVWEAVGRI